MENSESPNQPADIAIQPLAEPRWPAGMVFLTAWWLPATTARRTQHVSLKTACGIHFLVAIVAPALFFVGNCWASGDSLEWRLAGLTLEVRRAFDRWSVQDLAIYVLNAGLIEVGLIALALVLTPWGAADEPVHESFRHSLRQTWLHTADILPWVFALAMLSPMLEDSRSEVRDAVWAARQSRRQVSVMPQGELMIPPTLHQRAVQEAWQRAESRRFAWEAGLPWYIRHVDEITTFLFALAGWAVLWALLRSIGGKRSVPPIERSPMCEQCGYSLVGASSEGRCPECGLTVAESLGPGARRGSAWEQLCRMGRLKAWWTTSVQAAFRPVQFGRQLPVSSRVVDHRRFLVSHAVLLPVIVYLALVALVHLPTSSDSVMMDDLLWNAAPAIASYSLGIMLVLPMVTAGGVGLWLSWQSGRNLLPASMQVAAYLSALLAVYLLISELILVLLLLLANQQILYSWMQSPLLGIPVRAFVLLGWLGLNLAMLVGYVGRVYRATVTARFANR